MKLSISFAKIATVTVFAAIVGCSKPAAPTPEIAEPAPVADAAATTSPATEAQTPTADATANLSTVYFEFDSYTLTGDTKAELKKIASTVKAQAGVKIQVEGHCDERGSNEYNLALGERRARAIQEFLSTEGVGAEELSTISYGEERPAVQGSTEDAWTKNRRGEFRRL